MSEVPEAFRRFQRKEAPAGKAFDEAITNIFSALSASLRKDIEDFPAPSETHIREMERRYGANSPVVKALKEKRKGRKAGEELEKALTGNGLTKLSDGSLRTAGGDVYSADGKRITTLDGISYDLATGQAINPKTNQISLTGYSIDPKTGERNDAGISTFDPPATPQVDLRGPSAADLLVKNKDDVKAAENEGMRIWAEKFGGLAAKVKPGQAGYEVIQEVINPDSTGAAISPFAQAFADKKVGEMFTDNRLGESFTNSINLQNQFQGFELDTPAPYSNADLGDVDFLTASQMPSLLTSPGQSFEIPQALIEKAKSNPMKQDPDYGAALDKNIINYLETRTTEPVFDEATQSWKQVPISR